MIIYFYEEKGRERIFDIGVNADKKYMVFLGLTLMTLICAV